MFVYEMQPDDEMRPMMEDEAQMQERRPMMEREQDRRPMMEREMEREMERRPMMEQDRRPMMEREREERFRPGQQRMPFPRDFEMDEDREEDFLDITGQEAAFSRDARLIPDIRQAIIGEAQAYDYYERLAALAPNAFARRIILSIRQDEARHRRWFTMILLRLGGRVPFIPPAPLPRRYREGLRDAIRDELEAAAFYQNIAFRAVSRPIDNRFLHAARDEHRHASWLQYLLSTER